jgi:hypothetical protein
VLLMALVELEPLVALVPDQAPEAVQEEALVEDQVKVEPLPVVTVLGLALNLTVGAGAGTVCVISELVTTLSVADPAQPDRRTTLMLQATNLRTSSITCRHSD